MTPSSVDPIADMVRAFRLYVDRHIWNIQSFHIKPAFRRVKTQLFQSYSFLACTREKKPQLIRRLYQTNTLFYLDNVEVQVQTSYLITHMSHEQRIKYKINYKMATEISLHTYTLNRCAFSFFFNSCSTVATTLMVADVICHLDPLGISHFLYHLR